jgi:hypothetical protein
MSDKPEFPKRKLDPSGALHPFDVSECPYELAHEDPYKRHLAPFEANDEGRLIIFGRPVDVAFGKVKEISNVRVNGILIEAD